MLLIDREHEFGAPSGNDCWFMESFGKGVKFYSSEVVRNHSYKFQTYLHSKGLAPKTYFKCEAKYPNGCPIFAFETEVAETIYNSDRPREDYKKSIPILKSLLRNEGVDYNDWILGNVGFIDDRPVVIDCGYPMEFIE